MCVLIFDFLVVSFGSRVAMRIAIFATDPAGKFAKIPEAGFKASGSGRWEWGGGGGGGG